MESDEMDELFASIEVFSTPLQKMEKPLIVLDVQNVAMRHGKDTFFSTKGIQIAIQWWEKNGHKVIGFLPEYLFD